MKRDFIASLLYRLGVWRALDAFWGANRLTVLNYHRIFDSSNPDFDYDRSNVSATPDMFARHMDFVAQHFQVISVAQLAAFLVDSEPLPPRPLLITFDDGYLDNYEYARPVLKQYGFPAVIFLMTEGMTEQRRPWWDLCSYYFHHTRVSHADIPLLGRVELDTEAKRESARERLVDRVKDVPETQKQAVIAQLSELLSVPPPPPEQIFVTWDQVRELVADNIACQPHTVHHPILTRVDDEQQVAELRGSRDAIAEQTDQQIVAFAYPNGSVDDYNQASLNALRKLGYRMAFTLMSGPVRLSQVRRHPFEIQRVYLGQRDSFEMFALKVMGLPRLFERKQFIEKAD